MRLMNSSNIYRFNGTDPFDNWIVKDGELYGYYPRNSLVNILSSRNSLIIKDNIIIIPNTVLSIKGSCFRNIKNKEIYIPSSVKKISDNAFKNVDAVLYVVKNSYAEKYLKRKGMRYLVYEERNHQSQSGSNQTSK